MKTLQKSVKTAFNQRRKTLRNALKVLPWLTKKRTSLRAEQLSVDDFIQLTQSFEAEFELSKEYIEHIQSLIEERSV